jgi:nucleoside-diphosphate-sugar epimerase
MLGDGTQRRSMVYTGDLVHALRRAEVAQHAPGGVYWVADPEPYEMRTILETVRGALVAEGLAVSRRQPRLPRSVGELAAALDAALQRFGLYAQPAHVLGEMGRTIACDVSRARAELGYEPATDLEAGMRASIRWCLERGRPL